MHFCPKCGKAGFRLMGIGNLICIDPECRCHWSVDKDGKIKIKK